MWHIIISKLKALPISIAKLVFPPLRMIPTKLLTGKSSDGAASVGILSFASKLKRFVLVFIAIALVAAILWSVVSFSLFYMLNEEGLFNDLTNNEGIVTPGDKENQPSVSFDDISDMINRIDMEALKADCVKENEPLTITGLLGGSHPANMLYRENMSPYTFLRMYQLLAEICSDPLINPNRKKQAGSDATDGEAGEAAEDKDSQARLDAIEMTPGLLMAVLYHENGLDFGIRRDSLDPSKSSPPKDLDPYTAWTSMLGESWVTASGDGSIPPYWCGMYGQSFLTFREHTGLTAANEMDKAKLEVPGVPAGFSRTSANSFIKAPLSPNSLAGVGIPVLYISQVEQPLREGPRALVGYNNAKASEGDPSFGRIKFGALPSEVLSELQYSQHSEFPWSAIASDGGVAIERPSVLFFPDVSATVAHSFRMSVNSLDVSTGVSLTPEIAGKDSPFVKATKGLEENLFRQAGVGAWFAIRAAKPGMYETVGAGNSFIADILKDATERDLIKKLTGTAYLSGENGHTASYVLDNLLNILLPSVNQDSEVAYNLELQQELRKYLEVGPTTKIVPGEGTKQVTDMMYLLLAEEYFRNTARGVAMAAITAGYVDQSQSGSGGIASLALLGANPMDLNFDAMCDACGESVFEANSGCSHGVSTKLYWPVQKAPSCSFQRSASSCVGWHGAASGCPTHVKYSHFGWDLDAAQSEYYKLPIEPAIISSPAHDAYVNTIKQMQKYGQAFPNTGTNLTAARKGAMLYAIASGAIEYVSAASGFGNYAILYIADGATTDSSATAEEIKANAEVTIMYGHMLFDTTHFTGAGGGPSELRRISGGEVVGTAGSSGFSLGTHLHLQINKGCNTNQAPAEEISAINPITFAEQFSGACNQGILLGKIANNASPITITDYVESR